jgi:DNA polymerase V
MSKTFKYNSKEAGKTPTDGSTTGFPSPAADYLATGIDLNELLIEHPSSHHKAWLDDDNKRFLVIVDRALRLTDGCKVLAWDNGAWYLRRLKISGPNQWLLPLRGEGKPVLVNPDEPYTIMGRVSKLIWMNP